MGEALLTDYALVTWVLATVFCFSQLTKTKRAYVACGLGLAVTAVSVAVHGPTMAAAVLALIFVMLI